MKRLSIFLAFSLPLLTFGQLDRSVRPEPAKAPTINIGESEVFHTSNGITVILSENHMIPRVSFDLVMGADPHTEGNKAGLSEFAGSMILSGTETRTKDQLDNETDYIGARLDADRNSIYMSCLTKHLEKGLDLMSDVTMNAIFPESEFERIRAQYESSLISTKASPSSMATNAVLKTVFPDGNPNGEVMSEITLANIKRQDLVDYYDQVFTPSGSFLVIVGDINRETAEKMVNRYFGEWRGGPVFTNQLPDATLNNGNRVIFVNKPGAVQSVIQVAFPVDVKPGNEDQIPLTVTNQILGGGGFGTRMMQNLREDKAYTYGAYSRLNIDEDGSFFSAGGNFRNDVTDSAITELLYEIARISESDVTPEELDLTKSSMAGSFARSLENPQTVARFALATIKYDLDDDYYKNYLKRLSDVDAEDVLTMAQKYFPAKHCNIIVVGNEEVVEKLLKFDADGQIETLDAFGNKVVERKPADISKEELIENYLEAVTMSKSMKEVDKKLKKIKTAVEVSELSNSQIPFKLKSTRTWAAPNKEDFKLQGQGMLLQRSYFNGTTGGQVNMQTGKKELTEEEIAEKQKSTGFYPERNYATSGVEYELIGIEQVDGKEAYVLRVNDGSGDSYEYYDKETFYKVKSTSIETDEEETVETTVVYSDYKETEGLMFPTKTTISAGPMTFNSELVSLKLNEKVDSKTFE